MIAIRCLTCDARYDAPEWRPECQRCGSRETVERLPSDVREAIAEVRQLREGVTVRNAMDRTYDWRDPTLSDPPPPPEPRREERQRTPYDAGADPCDW